MDKKIELIEDDLEYVEEAYCEGRHGDDLAYMIGILREKINEIIYKLEGKKSGACKLCGNLTPELKEFNGKELCEQCYMGEAENPEHKIDK